MTEINLTNWCRTPQVSDTVPLGDLVLGLTEHKRGIWGDEIGTLETTRVTDEEIAGGQWVTEDAAKLNKIALIRGRGRVMSVKRTLRGTDFLIFTDIPGDSHEQFTTVILRDEY